MSEFTDIAKLAIEIADDFATIDIKSNGVLNTAMHKNTEWWDLENLTALQLPGVVRSVDYLEARGLLKKHGTKYFVRFVDPKTTDDAERAKDLEYWRSLMGEYFMGPPDGRCYSCQTDLVKLHKETGRFSSTGCPKCHRSFV